MCTLALLTPRSGPYGLILAANRDESLDRPSEGPQVWPGPPAFVAGRDALAGGTWLGVNAHGLVVGLTNHWTGSAPDTTRASRGGIVTGLLACRNLDEVRARLAGMDPEATNAYLLLAARAGEGAIWAATGTGLRAEEVEGPIFALGNSLPEEGSDTKPERALDRFVAIDPSEPIPARLRDDLAAALADHAGPKRDQGLCVHTERRFGTVSSTILLLAPAVTESWMWFAPGAPCTAKFEDRSALLRGIAEG